MYSHIHTNTCVSVKESHARAHTQTHACTHTRSCGQSWLITHRALRDKRTQGGTPRRGTSAACSEWSEGRSGSGRHLYAPAKTSTYTYYGTCCACSGLRTGRYANARVRECHVPAAGRADGQAGRRAGKLIGRLTDSHSDRQIHRPLYWMTRETL